MSLRRSLPLAALLVAACSSDPGIEPQDLRTLTVRGLESSQPRTNGFLVPTRLLAGAAFGEDWLEVQESKRGRWIPMRGQRADLEFASAGTGQRLRLELAAPEFLDSPQAVSLTLNGVELGRHDVAIGSASLDLALPPGSLHAGRNVLAFELDVVATTIPGEPARGALALFSLSVPDEVGGDRSSAELLELAAERALGDPAAMPAHSAVWSELYLAPGATLSLAGSADGGATLEASFWPTGALAPAWTATTVAAAGTWSIGVDTGGATTARTTDLDSLELTASGGLPAAGGRGLLTLMVHAAGGPVHLDSATLDTAWDAPNVVLISVDTLRADRVFGEGPSLFPSLEPMLARGVGFPKAFTHVPMTLPAHTALFSSRLPYASGIVRNGQPVAQDLPLLAEWLSEAGYDTRSSTTIGTLWAPEAGRLLDRGFHVYEADNNLMQAEPALERCMGAIDGVDPDLPFFLFLHFSDPHAPYNAHGTAHKEVTLELDGQVLERLDVSDMKEWEHRVSLTPGKHAVRMVADESFIVRSFDARLGEAGLQGGFTTGRALEGASELVYTFAVPGEEAVDVDLLGWIADDPDLDEKRRRYDLEATYLDEQLAILFERLGERGLLEDSIVVFVSDHGEAFGEHGWTGHAHQVFDEAMNVPVIIAPPEGSPLTEMLRGSADGIVRLVDVAPTVLDLMGMPPLPGQMGQSLLEEAPRVHYGEARPRNDGEQLYSFRDEEFLLILNHATDAFEMYDLVVDPAQLVDVFAERGTEREPWQEILRSIAEGKLGTTAGAFGGAEMSAQLEALGYL